jgi:hypothetical protein
MYIKINGKTYYLWRALDADGMVLDILAQKHRKQEAALDLPAPAGGGVSGRAASGRDRQAGQLRASQQAGTASDGTPPA